MSSKQIMMSKHLLCLFLLLLVLKVGHSQTNVYHPFPDSNVVWRQWCGGMAFDCDMDCHGQVCTSNIEMQDSLGGDTIINTYTYKKIFRIRLEKNFWQVGVTCNPGHLENMIYHIRKNTYEGAIRQDINARKLFILCPSQPLESVLYDFNLNVGDTLPSLFVSSPKSNYVFNVDSIFINGNYHKRFGISYLGLAYKYVDIIEGIGSTFGLLEQLVPPFEYRCGLSCVTVNSSTVYPDAITICPYINIPAGIKPNVNLMPFSIAPNPFNEFTTINITVPLNNAELSIYNLFGQEIKLIRNIYGQQIKLSREYLFNGIYFIRLRQDQKEIMSGKVVITD